MAGLTLEQIDAELAVVRTAILRISGEPVSSFTVGGRQVASEGVGKLEAMYMRERDLMATRTQLVRGGGIPVRTVITR